MFLPHQAINQRHFCDLCQGPRDCTEIYPVKSLEVVRCDDCGLVFVAPETISAAKVARMYSKEYFEGGASDGYADYSASEKTLRQQARRILRRLRRYQPSGTLLELGCAYGFFLMEAQSFFQTQGIEISTFAAQQAARRGLDVVAGDFRDIAVPQSHYSAVCLFDCIEHLVDPFAYLRKIRAVLRPEGVLALTTGDIGSLYARIAGRKWRLMTPPEHLFFFSRPTLSQMLEKSGFEVIEISYPWKLVPWQLVLYQVSPSLKKALGPLGRLSLGLYMNLFDAMLVIARKS